MGDFLFRLSKLILGLFLYAVGIIVTINANIGYAPWDVFHVGMHLTVGLSLGRVSILTGFVIVILTVLLGEKLGIGTILNMLLIGIFMDIILSSKVIPVATSFSFGVVMLVVGLLIISFATYFYISPGFGAGPRDGLMVALSRKLKLSVGICRSIIEFSALAVGYFLGGMVGIGTLMYVMLIGFVVQVTFNILKFDPKTIRHESIKDSIDRIKAR